jgi:Fe-S-cluster-containing dehydrogenase component/formate-dependent nitrite reductase membrane component NrfD
MNYGFIIDNRKCIGCHACTVACKAEHDVPIGVNRTWVKYIEKGEFPNTRRLFSVMRCNHCEDAPCVDICPTTALFHREDGIVDFDERRCIGCKSCMQACPYDALYIDPETETAAKCNYCAHRVDISLEPACVNVCPVHAIVSGDMDNPHSEISQLLAREQVTARKAEKGTRPKLFYINGDEASLNPIATEQSGSYMWSSQLSGVGHFAKYAEARVTEADPAELLSQLTGKNDGRENWVGGEGGEPDKVLVPGDRDSGKMLRKAMEVVQERARRVYDSPDKGMLWSTDVTAYIWTKAISSGAFLVLFLALVSGLAAVSERTQWAGVAVGLIFLGLTTVFLVKDLDQPLRFAYVLLRPQWKSWLVRGGYAITLYGGFLVLWAAAKWLEWRTIETVALWSAAILAVVTAVYTAFLFAQAKGRDFWQSPALVLHMLAHAVMAGTSAFAILSAFFESGEDWVSFLRAVFYVGIIFNLFVLFSEIVTTHSGEDAKKTVQIITSGRFRTGFWIGVVLIGNILPLALVWLGGQSLLSVAGALSLIGIYVNEHIWVRAPQLIPLS